MIERYSITSSPDNLRERFAVDVLDTYSPRFNASPTQILPVITTASPQGISFFYWGEIPAWAKNKTPGEKIINTRVETLTEKPALRKSLMKNRCIVPADGFYGWKKVGKKTSIPYRFVMNDKSIFSFPGLWEEYDDENGNEFHTFTIFTIASSGLIAEIQDRMPVIFNKATETAWLQKETSEQDLIALLSSPVIKDMNYYPVSARINDNSLDVPSLITPTPPADQFGNLTLFD
jgi:putative SOS response-associated peptidase YedK